MAMERVSLPPIPRLTNGTAGHDLRQWRRGAIRERQSVGSYRSGAVTGVLLTADNGSQTLVVPATHVPTIEVESILVCQKPSRIFEDSESHFVDPRVSWLRPSLEVVLAANLARLHQASRNARQSWQDRFHFKEERVDSNRNVIAKGLRPPQMGAIHAAIGHWRAQDDPATIVMPTGTGKTETMLALLIAEQIERLLVLVPTDALRRQIAEKFLSLGLLQSLNVIDSGAELPVVATLSTGLTTLSEVDQIVAPANVIVTTAALVAQCSPEVQAKIAEHCSHLFIDEAHHVPANTWYAFKQRFRAKKVLQFTATPFRRDGRLVEGRQIFAYPLRKAQAEDYFRPLKFVPLDIFPEAAGHKVIAEAAIHQLKEDLAAGFDHLIMARVDSIARAKATLKIYESAGDVPAVVIHSKLSDRELLRRLTALRSRTARVAICVDMFGEGFDMPELKIAALHDVHKSLTTTLQFVGRFTRSGKNVGAATLIVNIGDVRVEGALRELYQEDSDWNALLPGITERTTKRHHERSEFIKGFKDLPAEIPLHGVEPKMSALIYKTACTAWAPENATASVPVDTPCIGPVVNTNRTVAIYITRETTPVDWGRVASPADTSYHMYLAYWDEGRQLLFINSSNHDSFHEALVRDLSRGTAHLIAGDTVFRALKGLSRLSLMNLGLKHTMNRATRFTMYVGSDIIQGLSDANQQKRIKTNLFGKGYEDGERATVGCSLKGRIWSHRVAEDISEWIEWCQRLGTKLLDDTISTEQIFANVIWPAVAQARPYLFPIGIDWPDAFILQHDLGLEIEIDGFRAPFFDTLLELESPSEDAPLRFALSIDNHVASYEVVLTPNTLAFTPLLGQRAFLHFKRRGRVPIEEVFMREAPIIRFANGAWLEGNRLFPPSPTLSEPFTRDRIAAWDWSGIDLKRESQGPEKQSKSIQFRVMERLKAGELGSEYDLLIDDDGSNEIADIVGLKVTPKGELLIHLVHCKYSQEPTPGARIEDLYAVCGQAQKSILWRENVERMLTMLINRDSARAQRTGVSGIEVGDGKLLRKLKRRVHLLAPSLSVWIVQPGMSKAAATTNQLQLLAVTELFLKETCASPFGVIASM
jgi:superfamily II DNA or RNA helicase